MERPRIKSMGRAGICGDIWDVWGDTQNVGWRVINGMYRDKWKHIGIDEDMLGQQRFSCF